MSDLYRGTQSNSPLSRGIRVSFAHQDLMALDPKDVAKYPKTVELELSNNEISDIACLECLKGLRVLILDQNKLNSAAYRFYSMIHSFFFVFHLTLFHVIFFFNQVHSLFPQAVKRLLVYYLQRFHHLE